ncbi:hypothetical protein [Pseudoalteromonas luteoviolacea]|uniref:Uncharacterized protein n=1 Tax=Pseudoalteromonas luteoviolacea DSM 6061 TaxID=1365250 RepID=A0A167AAW4_9GAMM|nr:hypothetical protein [Pseudoalteromonas luteoviolacea]KZN45171.1 hypothetical protein N475_07910 [Pseudoalteromonas luteoviolacea DSM 6061]KZN60519.1 hypothetical protein N474_05595 [Pseudoalteromonas luteoviolacea CPMOR-2]MBE0386740.1 hypothetical protein [Pseudoalteromonas luteoviolacea DSM 6061]TQF71579.1 hypothetical protein FLM44_11020 [Pseudoalteromonas luteoviolacea]
MNKVKITDKVLESLEDHLIAKSITEFEYEDDKALTPQEMAIIEHIYNQNKTEQVPSNELNFEVQLLAASADQAGIDKPWWDFDTIINDTFQLAVFSSYGQDLSKYVDFELNPLKGKEREFNDYFDTFRGTKQGIRIYWAKNRRQVVMEGELVHSFEGDCVSGQGKIVSSEYFGNGHFKLMLEFFSLAGEEQ